MRATQPTTATAEATETAVAAINAEQYPCEWQRIALVCRRDGLAASLDFCAQTARLYRSAVLTTARRGHEHPHFAGLPQYRAKFIGSYLDFKRFLHQHQRGLS